VFFVYDNFDGAPNNGGNQVGGDVVFGVDASVTAEEATPEPRAWSLVALGLAAFSAVRLRQRRHRAIPGGSWRGMRTTAVH
jgi:MYXO-CTERM domain-containing protein